MSQGCPLFPQPPPSKDLHPLLSPYPSLKMNDNGSIFGRRVRHRACSNYVAENRHSIFREYSIVEVVFMGHFMQHAHLQLAKTFGLEQAILQHDNDFDFYRDLTKHCNCLKSSQTRDLALLGIGMPFSYCSLLTTARRSTSPRRAPYTG
jgi:hypothetical protein